jgi:hypothetical protein
MARPAIHPREILAGELDEVGDLQSAYDLRVAEIEAGKLIQKLPRRIVAA